MTATTTGFLILLHGVSVVIWDTMQSSMHSIASTEDKQNTLTENFFNMPAYSFQERFVPIVLDGSKDHTVRSRRKNAAKKGDKLYLYFGMRTKWCRKLREENCTDVKTIIIAHNQRGELEMIIFERRLTDFEFELLNGKINLLTHAKKTVLMGNERDLFAWRDGFRPEGTSAENPGGAWEMMQRWWSQTHDLPFIGDIIFWDPRPVEVSDKFDITKRQKMY